MWGHKVSAAAKYGRLVFSVRSRYGSLLGKKIQYALFIVTSDFVIDYTKIDYGIYT